MHYSNLVIIEEVEDIDAAVEKAMGAHEDEGGFWDFYQIGGRWTGTFDGYDPEKDPQNLQGDGKPKWPTQWARHKGDIIPVDDLTEEQLKKFYRVITPDHGIFVSERYEPWADQDSRFAKLAMPTLEWLKICYTSHLAVVVDNHS